MAFVSGFAANYIPASSREPSIGEGKEFEGGVFTSSIIYNSLTTELPLSRAFCLNCMLISSWFIRPIALDSGS